MFKQGSKLFLPHVLWCIGFCLVTFDLIWRVRWQGFTLKSFYIFFIASACAQALVVSKEKDISHYLRELLQPLIQTPLLFFLLIIIYYSLGAPFTSTAKKSIGYSLWGWFQLIVTYANGISVWRYAENKYGNAGKVWLQLLSIICLILSVVTTIDYFAYFYGFKGGLIGFNQDILLGVNVSRPHAFANEPSYLALFLSTSLAFFFADLSLQSKENRNLPYWQSLFSVLLCATAILLSSSRSGIIVSIAYCALLICTQFSSWKKNRKEILYFFLLMPCILILLFFITPQKQLKALNNHYIMPLITLQDGPSRARFHALSYAWEINKETHFLGTGIGSSYYYWRKKTRPDLYTSALPLDEQGSELIMSQWGQAVAEGGLPVSFLFLAFAISMIRKLKAGAKKMQSAPALSSLITGTIFFLIMAHGFGNLMRTDVWIWYTVWLFFSTKFSESNIQKV